MMGRTTEIQTVPYFWSAMFGKTIRYAGGGDFVFVCNFKMKHLEKITSFLENVCSVVPVYKKILKLKFRGVKRKDIVAIVAFSK